MFITVQIVIFAHQCIALPLKIVATSKSKTNRTIKLNGYKTQSSSSMPQISLYIFSCLNQKKDFESINVFYFVCVGQVKIY